MIRSCINSDSTLLVNRIQVYMRCHAVCIFLFGFSASLLFFHLYFMRFRTCLNRKPISNTKSATPCKRNLFSSLLIRIKSEPVSEKRALSLSLIIYCMLHLEIRGCTDFMIFLHPTLGQPDINWLTLSECNIPETPWWSLMPADRL